MRGWEQSKAEVDTYTNQVVAILRQNAGLFVEVVVADEEADRSRATDFVVRVAGGDIACRIRKSEYWRRYGQVTLRYSRPSGAKTEVAKILEGYARWLFYGWADMEFVAWVLLDLNAVRLLRVIEEAIARKQIKGNLDGSSQFLYLTRRDLQPEGVIAASGGEWPT